MGQSCSRIPSSCGAHPLSKGKIPDWIAASTRISSKRQQRINAGIVFFYWWLPWKERNQRTFEHEEHSFIQVVQLIKEEIYAFHSVHPV
jgi:hypothetical protein